MLKIAINGLDGVNSSIFKIAFERDDLEIVAINTLCDFSILAHLLKFNSSYGIYNHQISIENNHLFVDDYKIPIYSEEDPLNLPWQNLEVDVVIECSDATLAKRHLDAGARKVVISIPNHFESVKTIALGVNEDVLSSKDRTISIASPMVGCTSLILKLIEVNFGITKSTITTLEPFDASQNLLDSPMDSLYGSRSAINNIIPVPNRYSDAISSIIPALTGKVVSSSIHTPVTNVSLNDLTIITKQDITRSNLVHLLKSAANQPFFEGILDLSEENLVSSDFRGNAHSCIVDLSLTDVIGENFIKIATWCDNEWGYSNRVVELVADFGKGAYSS